MARKYSNMFAIRWKVLRTQAVPDIDAGTGPDKALVLHTSCALSLSLYLSLSLRVESAAQSGDLQVIAFLMPANGQTVECINDSANMNMAEKGHINVIYYTISYIEYIYHIQSTYIVYIREIIKNILL